MARSYILVKRGAKAREIVTPFFTVSMFGVNVLAGLLAAVLAALIIRFLNV